MKDGSVQNTMGIFELKPQGIEWGDVASFATKEEIDAYAQSRGWSVEYGNHRCPNCGFESERQGMYIDLGSWADAAGLAGHCVAQEDGYEMPKM
jgi:hypothetical protein